MQDLFDRFGLKGLINASGTETMHGSSRASPDVRAAAADALGRWIDMADFQRAASEAISAATGAEAGHVTGCSAAGVCIAVAAAMTGGDLYRVEQLPDTTGMKRRVVIQKGHEVQYGARIAQLIRLPGAEMVEIGATNRCEPFQLEGALREDTAAAVYVLSHHTVQSGMIPLKTFCAICRDRGVPVIVDAAAEYFWRDYLAAGATVVIFSAQKAAAGPTAGILAGERAFIAACAAQERGIGRPMKAGKESIAGAIVAIEQFAAADWPSIRAAERARLDRAEQLLSNLPGLGLQREPDPPGNPFDRLLLKVDPARCGLTAVELGDALLSGDPRIALRRTRIDRGILALDVRRITDDELDHLAGRVREILAAARPRAAE